MRIDRLGATRRLLAGAGTLVVAGSLLAACGDSGGQIGARVVGGDADLGKKEIVRYGCGSCHVIPGVEGADALVGPPLIHFSRRSFIAGRLANTPDNLVRWVMHPQQVEPGTDMPELGITDEQARNIAAYLEGIE